MNAGRELDALVAEKVMGWVRVPAKWRSDLMVPPEGTPITGGGIKFEGEPRIATTCPRYSTDIAAAWTVVDKVMERAFGVWLACTHEAGWRCDFKIDDTGIGNVSSGFDAASPPLAICRAALAAVGAEVPA